MQTGRDFEVVDHDNADIVILDWKASPEMVAEEIDKLLKQYGLVILEHPTGADFYAFSVQKA